MFLKIGSIVGCDGSQTISGMAFSSLESLYYAKAVNRTTNIIKDNSHPQHFLTCLPSGRCYRSVKARKWRLKNHSQAIKLVNDTHPLPLHLSLQDENELPHPSCTYTPQCNKNRRLQTTSTFSAHYIPLDANKQHGFLWLHKTLCIHVCYIAHTTFCFWVILWLLSIIWFLYSYIIGCWRIHREKNHCKV